MAADNAVVDRVSRPLQILLVAVAALAVMWFTVLRPKTTDTAAVPATPTAAPGTAGLSSAVAKAQGAVATSETNASQLQKAASTASGDTSSATSSSAPAAAAKPSTASAKPAVTAAAKAKAVAASKAAKVAAAKRAAAKHATSKAHAVAATGGSTAVTTKPATAKAPVAAAKPATTKAAKAKPAAKPAPVDPSSKLLAKLTHGKVLVLLFSGTGAVDQAARTAVTQLRKQDKKVVTAEVPIGKVGDYAAITTGVKVTTAPTILVIGTDKRAHVLTGLVDVVVLRQTVGDVHRAIAAAARSAAAKKKK